VRAVTVSVIVERQGLTAGWLFQSNSVFGTHNRCCCCCHSSAPVYHRPSQAHFVPQWHQPFVPLLLCYDCIPCFCCSDFFCFFFLRVLQTQPGACWASMTSALLPPSQTAPPPQAPQTKGGCTTAVQSMSHATKSPRHFLLSSRCDSFAASDAVHCMLGHRIVLLAELLCRSGFQTLPQ
jgi:hypothetical protein